MSTKVDPTLFGKLRSFGSDDFANCYTCGTCTATCPLADNDVLFPRQMIRYAQVGLKDELIASKELWSCYHCGACSAACPTEADPAEFMAAARRYAISRYDKTGLAGWMYRHAWATWLVSAIVAVLLTVFLVATADMMPKDQLRYFDFLPYHIIHWMGIAIMGLVVLFAAIGVIDMIRRMAGREKVSWASIVGSKAAWGRFFKAVWSAIGVESLGQKRYRKDCHDDEPVEPLWRRRWLIHALMVWGFVALLFATTANYVLAELHIRETGRPEQIWYPPRLIGTLGGLALMYGVSIFMLLRWRKQQRSLQHSTASDWLLLVLLWLTGFTGFVIEIALYVPTVPIWGYWFLVAHVVVAMELLLLLPFTKFAHVCYRPVALFFVALAKQ